jgi:hypothetical protein
MINSNMSAINNQPTNPQFLSPVGFNFSIRKLPNVNYFAQSINLPGVQLGETIFPTPFINIPIAGDHMSFGDMAITFKIDENMENYIELFNWIQYLGYPESFNQSKEIYDKNGLDSLSGLRNVQRTQRSLGAGGVSDATLTVLNSASVPNMSIEIEDAFPLSISDIQFDVRTPDIDYIEATATFKFKLFKIYRVSDTGNSNTSVRIAG